MSIVKQAEQDRPTKRSSCSQSGFSLIEIIIVIGLVAFVFMIAIPNFNLKTGTEVANRLARLGEDFRSAYDYSILTGKPCRLVFELYTGRYWLETTDHKDVFLGNRKVLNDPLPFEEDDRREQFDTDFDEYVELGEESFTSADSDDDIVTTSPVLRAKEQLRGPQWYKHQSLEWTGRSLGDALAIRSVIAEHHERAITVEDVGEEAVAFIYFLPQGYVEKAAMYIYYRLDGYSFDMEANPYRLVTKPYLGEARIDVISKHDVNIHEIGDDDDDA